MMNRAQFGQGQPQPGGRAGFQGAQAAPMQGAPAAPAANPQQQANIPPEELAQVKAQWEEFGRMMGWLPAEPGMEQQVGPPQPAALPVDPGMV